jgi:hypothetical protein
LGEGVTHEPPLEVALATPAFSSGGCELTFRGGSQAILA